MPGRRAIDSAGTPRTFGEEQVLGEVEVRRQDLSGQAARESRDPSPCTSLGVHGTPRRSACARCARRSPRGPPQSNKRPGVAVNRVNVTLDDEHAARLTTWSSASTSRRGPSPARFSRGTRRRRPRPPSHCRPAEPDSRRSRANRCRPRRPGCRTHDYARRTVEGHAPRRRNRRRSTIGRLSDRLAQPAERHCRAISEITAAARAASAPRPSRGSGDSRTALPPRAVAVACHRLRLPRSR